MDRYLGSQLLALVPITEDGRLDLSRLSLGTGLGVAWTWLLHSYSAAQTLMPSLTAVVAMWALDMVAGSLASWARGDRDPITRVVRVDATGAVIKGWRALSPNRAKAGLGKLVLWSLCLAVTLTLRTSHQTLCVWLAGLVESYILLTEAGSVLRNLGRAAGHRGLESAGELAEGRADGLLRRA